MTKEYAYSKEVDNELHSECKTTIHKLRAKNRRQAKAYRELQRSHVEWLHIAVTQGNRIKHLEAAIETQIRDGLQENTKISFSDIFIMLGMIAGIIAVGVYA